MRTSLSPLLLAFATLGFVAARVAAAPDTATPDAPAPDAPAPDVRDDGHDTGSGAAARDDATEGAEGELEPVEGLEFTIVGNRVRRSRVAGSAHKVSTEQLERMEHDDVHRVLSQVPGVYTRDEEGFGLRPNIGLRGANSDRSSKVTLMEDGILLGPAPYAAPAAYYIPLSTRLVGVEVFKGPASVKYGPQTVGGALNLQTRRVPFGTDAGIDVSAGTFRTGKAHGFVGVGDERLGFVLEGVHLGSAGFKVLDGGGDTGFSRNDLMWKGRLSNGYDSAVRHTLELKLGYGDERSNATYLGLSDVDFKQTPYRRYAASQLDQMRWTRTQAQLRYVMAWDELDVEVTAYRHDLSRAWTKFNRMASSLPVSRILANPDLGQTAVLYSVLSGAADSVLPEQTVRVGTNDRRYFSQGVQTRARYTAHLLGLEQTLELGMRLHQDQIRRLHDEGGYFMRSGVLIADGEALDILAQNTGTATALAVYASDELQYGNLLVAPGLRIEAIRTDFADHQTDETRSADQLAWMPGVGVSYQLLPDFNLLVGAHKGFSPVSPGQPDGVLPEESWNYEAGARYSGEGQRAELIGFFNQYQNLTGECTFSQGCIDDVINRQYNAGEVWVYGLEAGVGQQLRMGDVTLQADATYTLTLSRFQSSFTSENPLFGRVEAGDELPYVPVHRAAGQLVASLGTRVEGVVAASYTSEMWDQAGQGTPSPAERTEAALLIDAGVQVMLAPQSRLYLRADNVLGNDYLASRRPFGARPGKPLSFQVGLKHTF